MHIALRRSRAITLAPAGTPSPASVSITEVVLSRIMNFRPLCAVAFGLALSLTPSISCAASLPSAPASAPLLPAAFAGWQQVSGSSAPLVAAGFGSNSGTLQEFGFRKGESASYTRGASHLGIRVLEFTDATGAYGAFTFLRSPQMKPIPVSLDAVRVGNTSQVVRVKLTPAEMNGADAGPHALFWTGDLLVDADFGTAPADLSALAALQHALPPTPGPEGIAPSLPRHLPASDLDPSSVRYAIGPLAYTAEGGVLPPNILHFNQDAEIVTARYGSGGVLTLISYPTPQIADGRAAAIDSALKSGTVPGTKDALLVKVAGPLVGVTSGSFTPQQAKDVLDHIHYNDFLTFDHTRGYISEPAKAAKLLVGIASLTIILGGAAILLGFFLGGGRAAYRVLRGKPASTLNDEEFIALNLND